MASARSRLRRISPEIFYSDGSFLAADEELVALLKEHASRSPRRRCRVCFHGDERSPQQEMLIAMHRTSYVRPHRHFDKDETLAVIEGVGDTLLFNEAGELTAALDMSPPGHGGSFFYRMPKRMFHTLFFRSEWFVFIETTIGPFNRTMTESAAWAPPEEQAAEGLAYLSSLVRPREQEQSTG